MAHIDAHKSLNLVLLYDDESRAQLVAHACKKNNYRLNIQLAIDDNTLMSKLAEVPADIILVTVDTLPETTLNLFKTIGVAQPHPIVIFAEHDDSNAISEVVKAGVSAYVVDGLKAHRIKPVIEVALARFKEMQALREELQKTKTTLADRKLIDRAKGLLMDQRSFSEDQAYRALRKMAMDGNIRVADVAKNVISVAELLM